MKLALFQMKTSNSIYQNYKKIETIITKALEENCDYLLFPECCLTGYPPIEIESITSIDFHNVDQSIINIKKMLKGSKLSVAIGIVRKVENNIYNSVGFINETTTSFYDKRALWGWDKENFVSGNDIGVVKKDISIGIRICYEVRFPEYFRELFIHKSDIAFVHFCDVSDNENIERYDLLKSHLRTRAVENAMTIVSVNSVSKFQTAPTCVIDQDGVVIFEAEKNRENLFITDYCFTPNNYGREGRIQESKKLTTDST